ncbi:hypothetical protein O181_039373 [Austropuccinia psidii MF-1]|uniref:Uncharacterized protein n=1 Tax=Austropuccinia psidii MF-1 TaxID=1389203 RepID=A0A9Q3HBX6_9BASI|nr:hypothetical protein [Austropuccinia psidii MF-1]
MDTRTPNSPTGTILENEPCPSPLLGHHPMVTSLLDWSKVIIWPMKDGNEPSQHKEPPIPGPSPSSKPPEEVPTCELEAEVAPMQSMEDPFGIYRLTTEFDDSSSHRPKINEPNLVGASPLATDDSFRGCNSLKLDAPGIPGATKQPPLPGTGGLSKGGHRRDSPQISRKNKK